MAPAKESVAKALLARAHSPDTANQIFTNKILYREILLRPSSPEREDARDVRRRRRKREQTQERANAPHPKPLSARERRRKGFYDVPRDGQKYHIFEPLHSLWLGYAREVLGSGLYSGGPQAAARMVTADFHGAEVEVVRSQCVSRVGLKGIVIKDSKFVFEIITRKDRVKIVPKEGTMFRVEVPPEDEKKPQDAAADETSVPPQPFVFEVLGDQFLYRSADRANKKFKAHFLPNI